MTEKSIPKLTDVSPSKWSPWDGVHEGVQHLVQVGPRQPKGTSAEKRKPLGRRDVYLDGKLIGHVEQTEQTRDRKPAGRTYVTTRTHVIEWRWTDISGRGSHRITEKQMNDAVYRLAEQVFDASRKPAGTGE